jgi:hypothetical protein
MSEATQNTVESQAFYARPTFRDKFWRALGFRYHLGEEPPNAENLAGWIKTDCFLHLGWLDRLRFLVSGRLFVAVTVSTDTPSPTICKSRMDWRIVEPRGEWR